MGHFRILTLLKRECDTTRHLLLTIAKGLSSCYDSSDEIFLLESQMNFQHEFKSIFGFSPFPWQERFYEGLINNQPYDLCDIPTGLGKTKVISAWYLAYKANPEIVPRQLAYVVNRRTIVDQATTEVESLRNFVQDLLVSTMRGGLADNEEWKSDLTKPAIIVGTPDMVVSKLLFGGYGDARYARPIHAGILGHDTMFVIDEAHLSPVLCKTLETVSQFQSRSSITKPIRIVQLSATSGSTSQSTLTLDNDDYANSEVTTRINAPKLLTLVDLDNPETTLCKKVLELAKTFEQTSSRILIYVSSPKDAKTVYDSISKFARNRVELLTGTLRGFERDQLLTTTVVGHFVNNTLPDETVYLVSTSAGEVGWDIDADHLICDVAPLDSMIQRFGRVNRRGKNPNTKLYVLHTNNKLTDPIRNTRVLLQALNGQSLTPSYLRQVVSNAQSYLPTMLNPQPDSCQLEQHVIDSWSMTSISDEIPLKHKLEYYIHGVGSGEPDIYIAWRDEVSILSKYGIDPKKWLKKFPIQQQELLRESKSNFTKKWAELCKRVGEEEAVIYDNKPRLEKIRSIDINNLANKTLILPTEIGGLASGIFEPKSTVADDVAEEGLVARKRMLFVETDEGFDKYTKLLGDPVAIQSTLAQAIAAEATKMVPDRLQTISDDKTVVLVAYKTPLKSKALSSVQVMVDDHNDAVSKEADQIAQALGLPGEIVRTFKWAGQQHDLGKKEAIWQRSIFNMDTSVHYAKSGKSGMNPKALNSGQGSYRHELGSYLKSLSNIPPDIDMDLALYLIASHHGHGRPHFLPGSTGELGDLKVACLDIPARFSRLQHKYGHWGLAYLHAAFCSADIQVSGAI